MLTFQEVLHFTGAGYLQGDQGLPIKGVSIDSRTINPGELFIGLNGPHFKGEDFVCEAIEKGAGAVLVSSDYASSKRGDLKRNVSVGLINNSLMALQDLARGYRNILDVSIIAVTGSSGKTTTKDMIYTILSKTMSISKSKKSFNNHIGVCLSILKIQKNQRIACLELGTNAPGEIEQLASLVRPFIGVILNIGPAHLEKLHDLDGVLREKMNLYRYAQKGIYNSDDELLSGIIPKEEKYRSFGIYKDANVKASKIALLDKHGSEFNLLIDGEDLGRIRIPVTGVHQIYNVLAALCVSDMMMERNKIVVACSDIRLPEMRWEQREVNEILIINDAYNANPQSMMAALETYKGVKIRGRRFFVCGDMMELGSMSSRYHQQLGEDIKRYAIDYLVAVGMYADITASACLDQSGKKANSFCAKKDVVRFLMNHMKRGDAVLIKGSRALCLEDVAESLSSELMKQESVNHCS